jgi:hypothetical protein
MRKFFSILMATAVLFSFSACDEDTDITTLLGKMSAKIDGTAWSVSATEVSGNLGGVTAVLAQEKFLITGTSSEGKTVIILINGTNANQAYDLSPLEGETGAATVYRNSVDDAEADSYFSTMGSVTITSKTDNRISGSFYFTAAKSTSDVIQITEGKFDNVIYIKADNFTK